MEHEFLKEKIKTTLLNKHNKINAKKMQYLFQDPIYFEILIETPFLPKDSPINERIYCILNDIKVFPKCLFCERKQSFKLYRSKYLDTCGTAKCSALLRYHRVKETDK